MKKNLSMILALVMALSVSTSAFAADQTITEMGGGTTAQGNIDLNGTITDQAILISVTMPTSMVFTIGTEAATGQVVTNPDSPTATTPGTDDKVFSTLITGTGTITNRSNKPIAVDIVNVTDSYNLLKRVDLALIAGPDVSISTAMTKKLVAGAGKTALVGLMGANGSTLDLKIYGRAKTANVSGTEYPITLPTSSAVVTTTLKVTAVTA